MTARLRTALRETADAAPSFDLTADPWARGRQARRRRRAQAVGGLVGAGLLVGGLVVGIPRFASDTPPPASPEPVESTLPDRLFDVPPNVADIRDDPLGGPVAVVYWGSTAIRTGLWSKSAAVPLVVGAERDVVRAVRDLEGASHPISLSPDGTRLAASPQSSITEGKWPEVLVTDVVSGRTERFELPDPALGGEVEQLTWTPGGRELAVRVRALSEWLDDGAYMTDDRNVVLDTHTGNWRSRTNETPVAFSPDGRLELRWDGVGETGPTVANVDGSVQVTLEMRTVDGSRVEAWGSMAFSPDSEYVAVWGSRSISVPPNGGNPRSIEVYDVSTGTHLGAVDLGGLGGGSILGWGETGLLAFIPDGDIGTRFVRFDLSDLSDVSRVVVVRQDLEPDGMAIGPAAVPHAQLDAGVRAAEPPEARFDWVPWMPWMPWLVGVMLVVALIGLHQARGWRQSRLQSQREGPGTLNGWL